MKWPTRFRRSGERRVRVVFAWAPIEANDGCTYWLRRMIVTERWVSTHGVLFGARADHGHWMYEHAEPLAISAPTAAPRDP